MYISPYLHFSWISYFLSFPIYVFLLFSHFLLMCIHLHFAGIILWMCPANERWCYIVTSSLIGWAHKKMIPDFVNISPYFHTPSTFTHFHTSFSFQIFTQTFSFVSTFRGIFISLIFPSFPCIFIFHDFSIISMPLYFPSFSLFPDLAGKLCR